MIFPVDPIGDWLDYFRYFKIPLDNFPGLVGIRQIDKGVGGEFAALCDATGAWLVQASGESFKEFEPILTGEARFTWPHFKGLTILDQEGMTLISRSIQTRLCKFCFPGSLILCASRRRGQGRADPAR